MSSRLTESLEDLCRKVAQIRQRSIEAARSVDVVEEMSEHTNVSALNAGLEASRLGESGRNLVALADEVRRLAERSAAAAREISRGLDAIQEAVDDATRAAEGIRSQLAKQEQEP